MLFIQSVRHRLFTVRRSALPPSYYHNSFQLLNKNIFKTKPQQKQLQFFVSVPVLSVSKTPNLKNFSTTKPSPCRAVLSAFLPSFFKCPSLQGFTGVFGAVKKSRKRLAF